MTSTSTQASADTTTQDSAVHYRILSIVGLLLITVVLVQWGHGPWSVAPLFFGAVGLLFQRGSAAQFVLVSLLLLELLRFSGVPFGFRPMADPLMDLVLAIGTLVYLIGHYRQLGLLRPLTPSETRRARGSSHSGTRAATSVQRKELLYLIPGVIVPVVVAYVLLVFLEEVQSRFWLSIPNRLFVIVLLVLGMSSLVALLISIQGYLGWQRATREECLLYLQDQVWSETRGEQRRIQAWQAWAVKRQRGGGK